MSEKEMSLYPLLIITILALIVPIILHRIRERINIPVVVGEILCGILVGRSGLNLIQPNQWLDLLSLLGFTYLMFLGGLEIDFSMMWSSRVAGQRQERFRLSPFFMSIILLAGTLGLSYACVTFLFSSGMVRTPSHPLILTLLLGTTSVGVVMPTLKESRRINSPFGQTILLGAILADFFTIFLATVTIMVLEKGSHASKVSMLMLLGMAFYVIYRLGTSFLDSPLIRRIYLELSHTSAQLRVRTAFALMLLFAVMSQVVGVEVILGTFVAGAVFSMLFRSRGWEDEVKFDAIGYGFFIPIFFIMVGVRLDLSVLFEGPNLSRLMVFLAVALVVKIVPSLLLGLRYGMRHALAGGFLLSGRLSLIIAFAQIAVSAGLLEPDMNAIAVMIAVVTCVAAPVGYMRLLRAEPGVSEGVGIIVLGAGKVGRMLAQRFHERRHTVSLLDNDPHAVSKAHKSGLSVFDCQELNLDILKKAGVTDAHTFVAVTNDDHVNIQSCLRARELAGVKNLVARVGNPDHIDACIANGIRPVNTAMASVIALENIIYRPNVFSVLSHEQGDMEVVEVVITNTALAGLRVRDIAIPGDALLLMLQRNGITSAPHGNTRLQPGDIVTLLVHDDDITEVARLFDPDRPDHHYIELGDML